MSGAWRLSLDSGLPRSSSSCSKRERNTRKWRERKGLVGKVPLGLRSRFSESGILSGAGRLACIVSYRIVVVNRREFNFQKTPPSALTPREGVAEVAVYRRRFSAPLPRGRLRPLFNNVGVDLYHSGLAGFDECLTAHQGCGHLTIIVTCRSSKVNVPKEKLQLFGIQLVRILRMVEEEELSAQHGFSGLSGEHPRVDVE